MFYVSKMVFIFYTKYVKLTFIKTKIITQNIDLKVIYTHIANWTNILVPKGEYGRANSVVPILFKASFSLGLNSLV